MVIAHYLFYKRVRLPQRRCNLLTIVFKIKDRMPVYRIEKFALVLLPVKLSFIRNLI